MSDNNNGKKYFKKSLRNYGKYYSYKRLRNLMNTYFRVKISVPVTTDWQQNKINFKFDTLQPQAQKIDYIFALSEMILGGNSWEDYRRLFGFYKSRGVLFESEPKFINSVYFNTTTGQPVFPYPYNVIVGLINNNSVRPEYTTLLDSNQCVILSTSSKTRVYWRFTIKDFTQMPTTGTAALSIPFFIVILQQGDIVGEPSLPQWNIRLTYYITLRQSVV